ncbi:MULTISPECIES: hypothetical protein [Bacillaceae]|uniref:hypothetical protein n=1 Tax=Bacillaceae TaxID=186817 RepID=UPI00124949C9|nr:hypothetical protein [Robertmurraya sp. DFI.2.37]MDF1511098.1 hypothetical protein [Robertmurraya sp. DFI.2.37]
MEILAETTHWGIYWFILIIIGAVTLVCALGIMSVIVEWAKYGMEGEFIYGIYDTVSSGPDVTYKALITDFNEVYEQGYEIVDQDGKIYTIRESEAN